MGFIFKEFKVWGSGGGLDEINLQIWIIIEVGDSYIGVYFTIIIIMIYCYNYL